MAATAVVHAKTSSARSHAAVATPLVSSLLGRTSRADHGAASNLGDGLSLEGALSRSNGSRRQNEPRPSGGSCLARASSPRDAGSSRMASCLSNESRRWSESRRSGEHHPARVSHQVPGPATVPRAGGRTSPHEYGDRPNVSRPNVSRPYVSRPYVSRPYVSRPMFRTSVVRMSAARMSAARMSAVRTLSPARMCVLACCLMGTGRTAIARVGA